jgi:hypothetical protein
MTETKPYCKDCKHCIIDEFDIEIHDVEGLQLRFKDCLISDWFESVWFVDGDFYTYGGYICNLDELQPPDKCNCFEPKE